MDYNAVADSVVQAIYGAVDDVIIAAAPFVIIGILWILAKCALNKIVNFLPKNLIDRVSDR